MDNRTQNDKGTPPSGGAMDDLTAPTMQGTMPTLHVNPPSSAGSPSSSSPKSASVPTQMGNLDCTMVGTSPTIQTQAQGRSGAKTPATSGGRGPGSATIGGAQEATIVGALEPQDLSEELLLRDAPRMESQGSQRPSLNGIPLLYKLGQGGMGAVYYGVHPRLRSEVAVKVLPFHLAAQDPGMVQRFFREAQIAAKVRSPHLVSVIDVNEESGLFFLVMEYVSGVSMGQYLKKQIEEGRVGLSELDTIDSCIAACMGLDAAHSNGVIHRDLKPDNIMLPYKSRTEKTYDIRKAKLMDLGLARSEEGDQSLTGVQAAMGTPGYMAPEQALDAKTADKRSDVFGMGATIYALLAGRAPFKGEVVMKVLMATMHEPHPPITDFRPDVSQGLQDIINRCLDKHQDNRYDDAKALGRALRAARKVLAPDSAFGGDDDTDDSKDSKPRTAAPKIGSFTPYGSKSAAPPPSKMPLYGGIAAGVLLVGGLAYMFGSGKKNDDPNNKPTIGVATVDEKTKALVMQSHKDALNAVTDAITIKNFETVEFKFTSGVNADQQYAKAIPSLMADWDKMRHDIDSAKKADVFDSAVTQITLAIRKKDIETATALAKKLEPETPEQNSAATKLRNDISRAEKKLNNQGAFKTVLIEALDESKKIDERVELVAKALELIPDEPKAVELQKSLKVLQAVETTNKQFKLNYGKAQNLLLDKNYEAANDAITEAKRLKPEDKDAQKLAKQIFDKGGAELQKKFAARAKANALTAYESANKFFTDKNSAKAKEQIDIALSNVSDDDQYITLKKRIDLLIVEEERVAEVGRKKNFFAEALKEATGALEEATDVKKIGFIDVALEQINVAKQQKLEDPNLLSKDDPKTEEDLKGLLATLKTLEDKVTARKAGLDSRKKYDDILTESAKTLDENENDGKLAAIQAVLVKMDEALKIAAEKKVVNDKEIAVAEDLKKKLDAKKDEFTARDAKRTQVADMVKMGDDLVTAGKYSDALLTYKGAEVIVRDLSLDEKAVVIEKIKMADTKAKNLKEIDGIISVADKLIRDEKFDDAVAKLAEGEKIQEDKRFAVKKDDIEKKKVALTALVNESFKAAVASFKNGKWDDGVQEMQRTVTAHPSRSDAATALASFKEIQASENDIAATLPGLKQQFADKAPKVTDKDSIKTSKARAEDALEKLPKVGATVAENIAKAGMAGLATETATYTKLAKDLKTQASGAIAIIVNKYNDEEAARKPPPPPPVIKKDPGPIPKAKGEAEPDL